MSSKLQYSTRSTTFQLTTFSFKIVLSVKYIQHKIQKCVVAQLSWYVRTLAYVEVSRLSSEKTHTYFLPFYHLEQAMIGKPRTATFAVMRVYIPAVKAYYGIVIAQLFFLTQKLVKLTFCFTLSVHETWTQKELRCTYPNRPEPGGILKRPEIYIGWPS